MANPISVAYNFIAARWRWAHLRGEKLAHFQERHIHHIIHYAYTNSRFYRRHWHGYNLSSWQNLPMVDKSIMMENFSDFNTRHVDFHQALQIAQHAEVSRNFKPQINGITVGLSSGTSGHRGLFLVSPAEQAAWAGNILARALPKIPWRDIWSGGLRVAFILRSSSNLYESTRSRAIRFRYFDLADPVEQVVKNLNGFLPHILIAPPHMLAMLASKKQYHHLSISPSRVISVADVLEESDRQKISAAFSRPVEQIYQCTEGLLAVTCEHGCLHIQEDLVKIQWQPFIIHSSPVVQSQTTRAMPIITDLWRFTQPIIRYRLNDIVQLSAQKCTCGSPFQVIEAIEGRSDDILYFNTTSDRLIPIFPDTIRRAFLLADTYLDDYRCVQERPGQIKIFLDSSGNFDRTAAAVKTSLSDLFSHIESIPPELEFAFPVPAMPQNAKRRRVVRLYPPFDEGII